MYPLAMLLLMILGGLVGLFGLAILLREFVCWYLKINQRLAVMTELRDFLMLNAPEPGIFEGSSGESSRETDAVSEENGQITEDDIDFLHPGNATFQQEERWSCECGNVNAAQSNGTEQVCSECGRKRHDDLGASETKELFPDV
jgi:hypothetical protein